MQKQLTCCGQFFWSNWTVLSALFMLDIVVSDDLTLVLTKNISTNRLLSVTHCYISNVHVRRSIYFKLESCRHVGYGGSDCSHCTLQSKFNFTLGSDCSHCSPSSTSFLRGSDCSPSSTSHLKGVWLQFLQSKFNFTSRGVRLMSLQSKFNFPSEGVWLQSKFNFPSEGGSDYSFCSPSSTSLLGGSDCCHCSPSSTSLWEGSDFSEVGLQSLQLDPQPPTPRSEVELGLQCAMTAVGPHPHRSLCHSDIPCEARVDH